MGQGAPLIDLSRNPKQGIYFNEVMSSVRGTSSNKKQSNSVGFNIDCLLWMQRNEPKDLETFLKRFPKAQQMIFEHEYKEKTIGER